ncbi:hypothetical protein TorRG33x02_135580 [Trema orientale]|uniref:Uncharacterized protein n=1 Tax=Trema orientale TaxID=63057 RepID=A0A2P5EYT7_TREOI|nr:hypothetical protein TorRG33x02_135580 [Trema orientale]
MGKLNSSKEFSFTSSDFYLGRNSIRHVMMNKCGRLLLNSGAADVVGGGPDGTAPKTVAPLEFVVFKTDELVLQIQYFKFTLAHFIFF